MEIKNLLPIGTVVLLKGGQKKLMIFGVKQTDSESKIEYDYISVIYPEGNIGDEVQYFFNHDAIEKVFFVGLNDAERTEFIEKLEEYYWNAFDEKSE